MFSIMYSSNKGFKGHVPRSVSEKLNIRSSEYEGLKKSRRDGDSMSSKQSEWLPVPKHGNLREQEFSGIPSQHSSLLANTPIYSENEIQFRPASLKNRIGNFSEDLYAESLKEKVKLGLLDPIKFKATEEYRSSTSGLSPVHQNWSTVQNKSSIVSFSVRNNSLKTKQQKDQVAEDSLYSSCSSNFNTKAECSSIQPISDLKLESIDDEDEYLYGDTNSLPELSSKEKPKPLKEVVTNDNVWSDEEELSDVTCKPLPQSVTHDSFKNTFSSIKMNQTPSRKQSPNSRESSEWRLQREEGHKLMPTSVKGLAQLSKEKEVVQKLDSFQTMTKLLSNDKINSNTISHAKSQTLSPSNITNKYVSHGKFSDKGKFKDLSYETKTTFSVKKKPFQATLKDPPSEKKSKYSLATELLRLKGTTIPNEKQDDTIRKKLLDQKRNKKYPEKDISKQLIEKEVSILTSSRLEDIYVNVNRDEAFTKKRTVSVKGSTNSFSSDLNALEMEVVMQKEDPDGNDFSSGQKDQLPFSFSEKYDIGSQRTVRSVSGSPVVKRIVHQSPVKEKLLSANKYFKPNQNVDDFIKSKQQDITSFDKKLVTSIQEKIIKKNSLGEIVSIPKHLVQKNSKIYQLEDKHTGYYATEANPRHNVARERSPNRHSQEFSHHSREKSRERKPRHYADERSPRRYADERDDSPRRHSRERGSRYRSYERRHYVHERSPIRYERDSRHSNEHFRFRGRSPEHHYGKHASWEHDTHEFHKSQKYYPHDKSPLRERRRSYSRERDINQTSLEPSSGESSHSSPERTGKKNYISFPESKSSKLSVPGSMDISPNEKEDDLTKKLALLRKAKMVKDIGINKVNLQESSQPIKEIVVNKDIENDEISDTEENVINEDPNMNEASSSKVQNIQKISFVINRKQLPNDVSHPDESSNVLLTNSETPALGIPPVIIQPPAQPPVMPFQQYGYSPVIHGGFPSDSYTYPSVPPQPLLMPYIYPDPVRPYYPSEKDSSVKITKRPAHRVCSLKNIPTVSNIDSVISQDSALIEKHSEIHSDNQDKIPNKEKKSEFIATDSKDAVNINTGTEPVHQAIKKSSLIQISCKQSPTKQGPAVNDTKAAVNIEYYRKLLEERNQLYKKLKMYNKTVSDLDAAKNNIEKKCAKVRSLFEKQTCSQFESLIEKTKEQLTRYIEMSRNNASEIQKLKAKIPPQLLLQIQESIKNVEPEQEPSIVYNFFDSGNHWCEHCNKVFLTIPLLLQHFHEPGHPPCFDSNRKPWQFKESEILKPDELKEAKLEAVKGVEFLVPVTGFHCSLCSETLPDANSAEKHIKSHNHFFKYKNYVKENPVYEKMKNLARNFEQARISREKKKRELEQEKLSAAKRQKLMAKKDQEIKSQIENERKNEKTVTELCDDSLSGQLTDNSNTASNIKLHLADGRNSDTSKEIKNAPKPNFIGRAPNFKSRIKAKLQRASSPFDVKNAAEMSDEKEKRLASTNALKNGKVSCASVSSSAANILTSTSINAGNKEAGKQIQVIVAGEVIKSACPTQLEKEKNQGETTSFTENVERKLVAEVSSSTSNSNLQLPDWKTVASASEKKVKGTYAYTVRHNSEEEKDFLMLGINRNDFEPLAVPRPPPANLIQIRSGTENQNVNTECTFPKSANLSAVNVSIETSAARNIATLHSADMQQTSPSHGISCVPSQGLVSNSAPVTHPAVSINISSNVPQVVQYASPSVPTFNTSYPPPDLNATQSSFPMGSMPAIPPFPPPLQVPPPNVVLQCAQSNMHLSNSSQHNLPQYSVSSPPNYSSVSFIPTINAHQNVTPSPKSSFNQHSPTKIEHHSCLNRNLTVVNVNAKDAPSAGNTENKPIILTADNQSIKSNKAVSTTETKHSICIQEPSNSALNESVGVTDKTVELDRNGNETKSGTELLLKNHTSAELLEKNETDEKDEMKSAVVSEPTVQEEMSPVPVSSDVNFDSFFEISSIKRQKQITEGSESTETSKVLSIESASSTENKNVSSFETQKEDDKLVSASINLDTNTQDFQLHTHEFSDKNNVSVSPLKISATETALECNNASEICLDKDDPPKSTNKNSVEPDKLSEVISFDISTIENISDKTESKILSGGENGDISQGVDVCASDESCSLNVNEENTKATSVSVPPSPSLDKQLIKPDSSSTEYEEQISDSCTQQSNNFNQYNLTVESGNSFEPSSVMLLNGTNISLNTSSSSPIIEQSTNTSFETLSSESIIEPLTVDHVKSNEVPEEKALDSDCQQTDYNEIEAGTSNAIASSSNTNVPKSQCLIQSVPISSTMEDSTDASTEHVQCEIKSSSSNFEGAIEHSQKENFLETQCDPPQKFASFSFEDSSCSAIFSDPIESTVDNENVQSGVKSEPIGAKFSESVICNINFSPDNSNQSSTHLLHSNTESDSIPTCFNDANKELTNDDGNDTNTTEKASSTIAVAAALLEPKHTLCDAQATDKMHNESADPTHDSSVANSFRQIDVIPDQGDHSNFSHIDLNESSVSEKHLVDRNISKLSSDINNEFEIAENTSSSTAIQLLQELDGEKLTQQHTSDGQSKGEEITSLSEIVYQVEDDEGIANEKATEITVLKSKVEEVLSEENATHQKVDAGLKNEEALSAESAVPTNSREDSVSCEQVPAVTTEKKADSNTEECKSDAS